MRVSLDATPLLGRPTGVGTYVSGLVSGLVDLGVDVGLTPFTLRGRDRPAGLPAQARWRARPVPARLLQAAWRRSAWPPAEWLTGRTDLFHGTNFVLPPRRHVPGVVTVHDLTFQRHPEWVQPSVLRYRELVPRAVRTAAAVLTPSQTVADEVIDEYGVDPSRVRTTPLGVSPAWASSTPPTPAWLAARGLPSTYLLFVGAREPRKNLPTLIEAHRRAGAAVPPLVLAGPEGWGVGASQPPGVWTTGYLEAGDLRSLVAGAVALVLPSWYEGFGLPILEALASGTPVVASDIAAHREVAGAYAALFPPDDPDALAAELEVAVRQGRSAAQAAAGRQHASTFSWARCAQRTLETYEDVVA